MTAFLAAVLLGSALLLAGPGHARSLSGRPSNVPPGRGRDERGLLVALRLPLSLAAALGGWVLFGGPVGLLVAGVAGAFSWRVLSKVEPPALVRRRRELERDLPIAVHLFGSALAVGSSTTRALADVAEALPGSVADEFSLLRRRLELGADPASVWRSVEGPLQPLGRTMARAQESGSLVVAAVERLGAELSAAVAVRRAARVRTVEVRAAMPLGVCFLPAFVVLGVIPMVVGIFSSLSLFD